MEHQPLEDVLGRAQSEQRLVTADGQPLAEHLTRERHVVGTGVEEVVLEHRPDQPPHVAVVRRQREAASHAVPVSVQAAGPVDGVEPVAGIVAVPIEALRAKYVGSGVEERHALRERHGGQRQVLQAHAVGGRKVGRQLVLEDVPQRLVVVVRHVDDVILGHQAIAGGSAVVVHVASADRLPFCADERHVGQVAGQANPNQVHRPQHRLTLDFGVRPRCLVVRQHVPARGEPLGRADRVGAVERSATAHAVPQPVVERAVAASCHVDLRRVGTAGVLRDLTEVPSLAVDVDAGAMHAVRLGGKGVEGGPHRLHVRHHVMPHQVETEAVDLVLLRPQTHHVDHQAFHHGVLGGGVGAAGAGGDVARVVEAVVVAGDDAVQHRALRLSGGVGVVVHHVGYHPQAHVPQRHHHLAVLHDARRSVRVGGVASLGHAVVVRVVAPVEGIVVARVLDGRLGLRAGMRQLGVRRRRPPGRRVLVDGGDVERRQQVHVREARACQRAQVLDTVTAVEGEGEVLAHQVVRHGGVGRREVPHVQFVDDDVDRVVHGRLDQVIPPWGREQRIVQVDELAARGVLGQARRVRVGDEVGDDAAGGRREDLDLEQVVLEGPLRRAGDAPHAAGVVPRHRQALDGVGGGIGEPKEVDAAGGGRPYRYGRNAVSPVHAERRVERRAREDVVEHSSDLQAGGVHHLTVHQTRDR